jgi:hypothetical protein
MDIQSSIVLSTCLYKLACLAVGLFMAYMGYKLFLTGHSWDTSDMKFSWKGLAPSAIKTGVFSSSIAQTGNSLTTP